MVGGESEEERHYGIIILWMIWCARNKEVFEGTKQQITGIHAWIQQALWNNSR